MDDVRSQALRFIILEEDKEIQKMANISLGQDVFGLIFTMQDLGDKARCPRKGEKLSNWKDKSKWYAYHENFG